MKKSIKTIGTIATIVIMSVCSYIAGTTQAKTKTDMTIITKTVTKEVEVIPDNYISLDKCIPLDDIVGYYIDSNDYICFSLADYNNQLDDTANTSYNDILSSIDYLGEVDIKDN